MRADRERGDPALFREYDHNLRDTDIIIENVAKLTDIIRNIMQKSRQDQVQVQQLLSLSSVMREELKFLDADLFFKHNVEKHYDLAEDLPFIKEFIPTSLRHSSTSYRTPSTPCTTASARSCS